MQYSVSILKSKFLFINNKLIVYKIVVRPVMLYASETWTLTKKRNMGGVLRKIFILICKNRE